MQVGEGINGEKGSVNRYGSAALFSIARKERTTPHSIVLIPLCHPTDDERTNPVPIRAL